MSCLDEDAVLAWLDGDPSNIDAVEAHVDACAECRQLVSALAAERASVPPPTIGSLVDERYEILAAAGRGGMGRVYHARDRTTGRSVALKRVEVDDARFAREAKVLAGLAHPGIVGYVADGRGADGARYLVMEWLEGEDLARRLERGPLTVEEAVSLGRRVSSALGAAHARGVVHRDVKPSNLFLVGGRVDDVKVVDFGLARADAATSVRTRTGALLGTPSYMAPEQAKGDRDVGPTADVFSLGCVLYECLTGERAFGGAHVLAVLSNLLTSKPPRPRARAPHVPRDLDDVIARMLARDPAKRPQNGAAVETELALRAVARPTKRAIAAAVAVGVALAVGVFARARPPRASAVTDFTPNTKLTAEASAEYRAGLEAIREASLTRAREHLERAVALEPTLAAAHLRLAVWTDTVLTPAEARAHFQAARTHAAVLEERDRGLLEAIEPGYQEPPDMAEAQRRLKAVAARHPADAELALLGIGVSGAETGPEAYDTVLRLDPQFGYAWWARANAFFRVNDTASARTALDRCLAASPRSTLCLLLRTRVDAREGRCEEMERDARLVVALENGGDFGLAHLENALTARGADRAAVEETIHARAVGVPNERLRRKTEHFDRACLDAAYGDFDAAERELRAFADLVKDEPFAQEHVRWTALLVDVLEERGDDMGAARVADDYLKRRAAWRSAALRPNDEPLPAFLGAAARGGLRSEAEVTRERDAWASEWKTKLGISPEEVWLQGWARPARTASDLAAAGERMPPGAATKTLLPSPPGRINVQGFANVHGGRVQLAVGRAAEAASTIGGIARHCSVLADPVNHRRAFLWLGQAHEATGDRALACVDYAGVLSRWAGATPRSVTVEAARARMRALRCP